MAKIKFDFKKVAKEELDETKVDEVIKTDDTKQIDDIETEITINEDGVNVNETVTTDTDTDTDTDTETVTTDEDNVVDDNQTTIDVSEKLAENEEGEELSDNQTFNDAVAETDKIGEEIAETEEEIEEAEDQIEALESIAESILVVAPDKLDEEGNPVIDESTGSIAKDLDAIVPADQRLILTAGTTLVGADIEPKDVVGEVALPIDDERVITTEGLNPITYRSAMEGVGSSLKNLGKTIMDFIKKIIRRIGDFSKSFIQLMPMMKSKIESLIKTAKKYQAEGYVLPNGNNTYTVNSTNVYKFGIDNYVKNSSDLTNVLKQTEMNSKEFKIFGIDDIINDIYKIYSNYKSILNRKEFSNQTEFGYGLNLALLAIGKDIAEIDTSALNKNSYDNNNNKAVKIGSDEIILKGIALGGYYIGYKNTYGDSVAIGSKEHADILKDLKNPPFDMETGKAEPIIKYRKLLDTAISTLIDVCTPKDGLLPVDESKNIEVSTLTLDQISSSGSSLLKILENIRKYRGDGYIRAREDILVKSEKILAEIEANEKSYEKFNGKMPSSLKYFYDLIKSNVTLITKQIELPINYSKSTIISGLKILGENLSKYQAPAKG